MGKTINHERVKQLTRILSGEEKPPVDNRLADRKRSILMQMTAKDILKDLRSARVMIRNAVLLPDPSGPYLFFYSVYTLIENKDYQTLDEPEAENKLKQFPDTKIYYCRLQGAPDNPPSILKGKKMSKEIVSGHEDLSELIFTKTGVKVPETDLMIPQSNKVKDLRPIGLRAADFVAKVKKRDEEHK